MTIPGALLAAIIGAFLVSIGLYGIKIVRASEN